MMSGGERGPVVLANPSGDPELAFIDGYHGGAGHAPGPARTRPLLRGAAGGTVDLRVVSGPGAAGDILHAGRSRTRAGTR